MSKFQKRATEPIISSGYFSLLPTDLKLELVKFCSLDCERRCVKCFTYSKIAVRTACYRCDNMFIVLCDECHAYWWLLGHKYYNTDMGFHLWHTIKAKPRMTIIERMRVLCWKIGIPASLV
jgi:hypothetical protein